MKKKQLFIILGVFVFLVLAIILTFFWQNNRYQQNVEEIVPMEDYEPIDPELSTPPEELSPETLQESLNLLEL
jgi:flagellar basal body-associated protein FliL